MSPTKLTRTTTLAALCLTPLLAIPTPASALTTSTFDNGNDGWRIADVDPTLPINNPATYDDLPWDNGSVRVGDVTAWTHIAAPAKYLGPKATALGRTMSYDLLIRYTDGLPYSAVALAGFGKTLYYVIPTPQLNVLTHITVPFTPSSNWVVGGYQSTTLATEQDFRNVLGDLKGLYIMTEWNTGPDDTNVDNVVFPADLLGDTNFDNVVDGVDRANVANGFANHLAGWSNGDFNGDGKITPDDWALFNLGASLYYPGSTLIPEPASATLLSLATTLLTRRKRLP